MFCTECGKQVDPAKNFCGNCGARLMKATEPTPSSTIEEVQTPASTPTQAAPRAISDKLSAPRTPSVPIAPVKEGHGISTSMILGVALVLVVAAGAGIYFGTDVLRRPVKPEPAPVEQARVAPKAPPGTVEEPKIAGETSDSNLASTVEPPESAQQAPAGGSKSGPAPSSASQRGANPGIYEVLRATSVFEGPSGSSRILANIPAGTRVSVVNSNGDWLEVHSKSGNPPGFIRRDDPSFVEKSN
jgi:hypothetical protein